MKTNESRRWTARRKVSQAILHIVLIFSLILVLYPLLMMVFGAFKSGTEYNSNKWLPALPLRLSNLSDAFESIRIYLFNTLIVALFGIVGMIVISSMSSFAISKLKFKGNKVCFYLVLALTMVPGRALSHVAVSVVQELRHAGQPDGAHCAHVDGRMRIRRISAVQFLRRFAR